MTHGGLLALIADWTEANGRPPTIPECAGAFGVRQDEVRQALAALTDEGFITKVPGQRAIEIAKD